MFLSRLINSKTAILLSGLATAVAVGSATSADADTLLSGQTATETIGPGSIASYDIQVGNGATLFVGLRDGDRFSSGSNPRVTLFDDNGTQVFQQSTSNAFNEKLTITNGGSLRAIVESAPGGEYSLQFTSIPGAQSFATGGGQLANGTPVVADFLRGEADTYTFSANAGDTFFLSVRDGDRFSSGSNPRATLFQPDATEIFEQSLSNFFVTPIVAPQSGEYSLVVATGGGGGGYAVQVSNVGEKPSFASGGGNVVDGQLYEGTLERGEADTFLFAVDPNSNVFVGLSDTDRFSSGSNPRLTIFDPSGSEVFDQSTSSNFTQQLPLDTGGIYTAVVSGNGGGYTLQLDGVTEVPEPTSAALISLAGLTLLRRRRPAA